MKPHNKAIERNSRLVTGLARASPAPTLESAHGWRYV